MVKLRASIDANESSLWLHVGRTSHADFLTELWFLRDAEHVCVVIVMVTFGKLTVL